MKKIFSLLILAMSGLSTMAQQNVWKSDPMHSKLAFSTTHLGISDVDGVFDKFTATATASKADFSDAVFELQVDVSSIDTDIEMRDKHLRTADFFDVEKYPEMTFKSTGIKSNGANKYQLTGNLTFHGVTKPVTMDLWYRGTINDPKTKKSTAGFQLTGTIKRSEFGLGTKFPVQMLSDEVKIKADGEFKQQ